MTISNNNKLEMLACWKIDIKMFSMQIVIVDIVN